LPSLAERIQADLITAMKAREQARVETLRGLGSDLKYRRIELGSDLKEADVVAVLRKAAKKRREAIAAYEQGGRPELAAKEAAELEVIGAYLPAELSDDHLDQLIREVLTEAGAADPSLVGKVMSQVMPKVKGQVSGERVRNRVQTLLQGE
jgi:uncharacterized protein YqeY